MAKLDGKRASSREQIFDFLVRYKREHDGLSPSLDELAEDTGLSRATVRYHLLRLEADNRIRFVARRGIEITGGVWDLPGDSSG